MRRSRTLSNREIFGIPALLAVLSTAGLVIALLGETWFDIVSWILLAIPLLAVGQAIRRRA